MPDSEDTEPVVVTLTSPIMTEEGAFEMFEAADYTERPDCFAFHGTDVSRGTVQVQKDNLNSIVYL